jgi:hypothetical protein
MQDVPDKTDKPPVAGVGDKIMRRRRYLFELDFGMQTDDLLIAALAQADQNSQEQTDKLRHLSDREKLSLLRSLGSVATVLLRPSPGERSEQLVFPDWVTDSSERMPWHDVYAPPLHQPLHRSFAEFVALRFADELKVHVQSYVELYTFGAAALERSIDGLAESWSLEWNARQQWIEHISHHYSGPGWATEPWVKHALSKELLQKLEMRAARLRVLEDRHGPLEPVSLERCARLLVDGIEGYWQANRSELASEFRRDFLDGSKIACRIDDDGSICEVSRTWWQSQECTRVLMRQDFQGPDGVLLESFVRREYDDDTFGGIVLTAAKELQELSLKPSDRRMFELMMAMVEDGTIPRVCHSVDELRAAFRKAYPELEIVERAFERARGYLLEEYPELARKPGRPRK